MMPSIFDEPFGGEHSMSELRAKSMRHPVDAAHRIRELEKALTLAADFAREAMNYGCEFPIGLDTDAVEQRGGPRDTFIRNAELAQQAISAVLTPGERA